MAIIENTKQKIEMSRDAFLSAMDKMEHYPDTLHDYGLTNEDLTRMESDPEKYIRFVLYLMTREYADDHVFINPDALEPSTIQFHLNELVRKKVALC